MVDVSKTKQKNHIKKGKVKTKWKYLYFAQTIRPWIREVEHKDDDNDNVNDEGQNAFSVAAVASLIQRETTVEDQRG